MTTFTKVPQPTGGVLQQEYEAEQEYIKTLSYLSAEEQRKYKERQSVSFMYQKPPGMDCAVTKPKVCLLLQLFLFHAQHML